MRFPHNEEYRESVRDFLTRNRLLAGTPAKKSDIATAKKSDIEVWWEPLTPDGTRRLRGRNTVTKMEAVVHVSDDLRMRDDATAMRFITESLMRQLEPSPLLTYCRVTLTILMPTLSRSRARYLDFLMERSLPGYLHVSLPRKSTLTASSDAYTATHMVGTVYMIHATDFLDSTDPQSPTITLHDPVGYRGDLS